MTPCLTALHPIDSSQVTYVTRLEIAYKSTSHFNAATTLCYPCDTFDYVSSAFFSNFFITQLPRDHNISCLIHYLEPANSKPFTGWTGLRHATTNSGIKAIEAGWLDAPLAHRNLAEAIEGDFFPFYRRRRLVRLLAGG